MANFNDEQKAAKATRAGNFLISAGAGSGKTQVLTARIKEIIQEKAARVDELLVLTFTNKAAAEMKSRTRNALLEEMPEEAEQVETSDITTFDAFFLKLVKKYAYELNVDPDISVANEAFLDIRKTELINELIDERYEKGDKVLLEMTHQYVLKKDDNLTDYIKSILNGAQLESDVEAYFTSLKEDYFTDAYFEKRMGEFYKKCNDDIKAAYEITDFGSTNTLASDHSYIGSFVNTGSYEALYKRMALEKEAKDKGEKVIINGNEFNTDFIQKSRKEVFSEEESLRRDMAKKIFGEVKGLINEYGDPARQIEKIRFTKPYVGLLVDIAKEVHEKLKEYKKEKNVYSFSDIASLARELLDKPHVLKKIRNQYKFIMVDEYQDTSDLQEDFIMKISNNNLFFVGDIKQSIYRFRNANPDIFSEKLKNYSNKNGGKVITLPKNYRSRKEVIDCINKLFGRVMSPSIGDVDYNNGQALEFGNVGLYGDIDKPEYKTKILRYEKPDDLTTDEAEAKIIAKDIIDKVKSGFVVDVKGEGNRPCTWKDFAILIPKKAHFGIYQRVFKEAKIPLVATLDEDFSDDNINLLFMSLLKMPLAVGVDEITTKHCYASIKRSYLYQEADDQLLDELISGSYKEDQLVKDMKEDKNTLIDMGVYDATMFLVEKYKLIDKLLVIGDVKENFEKINHLISLSVEADRMGLNYTQYVEHFENLKQFKIKDKISINKGTGDQVRLMSVHASKGLEFPIVYSPNNISKYNDRETQGYYITAKGYGLLAPYNRSDEISKNFLYNLFKQEESSKALSEYMRLFYVSLTRASDQIIFVLPEGKEEKFFKFTANGKEYLGKVGKDIDKNGKEKTSYSSVTINSFASFLNLAGDDFIKSEFVEEKVAVEDAINEKEALFADVFDAPKLGSINVEPQIIEQHRASKESLLPLNNEALERGTRLHRLLELTDFVTKDTSFIKNEKDKKLIDKLLTHDIFKDISKYKIFKEYQYFDEEENVNGIIDLLLVEKGGDAIIVDYKTSHIDDPAYVEQLKTYKRYVDRTFGVNAKAYLLSIMKDKDNLKVVE